MPISDREKKGCIDLLEVLSDCDLYSLADTVSNKKIPVGGNRREALKTIVTFSNSAQELLSRQKINKDVLFKYLVKYNVTPSVNTKKPELIDEVLALWMKQSQKQSQVKVYTPQASPSSSRLSSRDLASASHTFNAVKLESHSVVNYSPTINFTINNQYNTVNVNPVVGGASHEQDLHKLGLTFIKWFYDSLNSHNPSRGVIPKDFGPQHFYGDAKLMVLLPGPPETRENCTGQQAVSEKFLHFVSRENLLFNPNCDHGGVMVKDDPHGLVVVMVCGTIHKDNQCLGVFDQMFGLIKDPQFHNNYKIKISKMKLTATAVSNLPRLTDKSQAEISDLAAV